MSLARNGITLSLFFTPNFHQYQVATTIFSTLKPRSMGRHKGGERCYLSRRSVETDTIKSPVAAFEFIGGRGDCICNKKYKRTAFG